MTQARYDAPEQVLDRTASPGDNARALLVADTQELYSPRQAAPRSHAGEYNLGVPKDKLPDLGALLNKDENFQRRFFDMTGENGNTVEPALNGILAPDSYRNMAFRQIIGKYGADRVKETFAALEKMDGSALTAGRDLRPEEPSVAAQNKKLDLLANLMKPGKIEAVQDVVQALKRDGFTKHLTLEQMNDDKLLKTLADPAQRKALIELEQKSGPLAGAYMRDNRHYNEMTPVQNLEGFKQYKAKFDDKQAQIAKPYLDEIARAGQDPTAHISDAMRHNRVLMLGEQHSLDGPMHKFGADSMPALKAAGATHLALEMTQERLDKYTKSRNLQDLPEAFRTQNFAKMIDNARASGMKVVGIDNGTGDVDAKAAQQRDNFMAGNIKHILDADKNNKVVFWSGMMHGADTTAGASRSTADILRSQKVSVNTTMEQSSANADDEVSFRARNLDKPTAIATKKTPLIARTEVPRTGNDIDERYGLWDSVLIFPNKK